ncbi:MAG: 3-phosphoshikimate 1-carboxyvinyltransferase [Saprospiraceae bacterium]|nr:3-phosphoshikimate 1-carboxyvinyltransferase [Saprospiraceae bacterium]
MDILRLSKPDRRLFGEVFLDGSKSLSNRALIALTLADADPDEWLTHLSASTDTTTLLRLLRQPGDVYDAGDAGTTFRFLTAWLALRPGAHVLTGSARMQQRPIGPLVNALRTLGAGIEYLGQTGFPPIRITGGNFSESGTSNTPITLHIDAGVSSQFLSALLLIGPYLPGGLILIPEGRLVSGPYLDMTMQVMQHFGAEVEFFTAEGQRLGKNKNIPGLHAFAVHDQSAFVVQPGRYQPRPLAIEADWSAASYWYAMAAFADEADLMLHGLTETSWQGDSVLVRMMEPFGVQTAPPPPLEGRGDVANTASQTRVFSKNRLEQKDDDTNADAYATSPFPRGGGAGGGATRPEQFRQDFRACPDLAQTLAVVCAGLGVPAVFSGLETLAVKETDRCAALAAELAKVGVRFEADARNPGQYRLAGKAEWQTTPRFATWGDHRMAMALAPLAMFGPIEIENPGVVSKSYPEFWQHLQGAGFQLEKIPAP